MDYQIITVIFILLVAVIIATRDAVATILVLSSFLILFLPLWFGTEPLFLICSSGLLLLFLITLVFSMRSGFFSFMAERNIKKWRILARPFAFLFIPIDIFIGHRFLIILLGYLALIFIGIDLYRLITKKKLSKIFKEKEHAHFSSMTGFMVSVFIVFLLFQSEIAYLCLGFILIGDLASKFIGIKYGRNHIIHDRTVEGSLGFLTGSLYIGCILYAIFEFSMIWLIVGAFTATLTELFSWKIDDNFSVGIITGCVLIAMKYFWGI